MKFPPNVQAPRRIGAFSLIPLALFAAVTLLGFWIATEWCAAKLGYQPRLGAAWLTLGHVRLYAPWAIFAWMYWYSSYAEVIFRTAFFITAASPVLGVVVLVVYAVWRARKARVATTHGSARWASEEECAAAGSLGADGVVLGVSPDGRLLRDNGPEHVACIAPTRSGKGVGQVIPTLLTWPGSVLVHDIKGENWAITASWRSEFSYVIYFNPTDPDSSAHFNPLLEVRLDDNQIRDVQNIADQLVDPFGKGKESHWERTAEQFFLGVILHVLHAEPDKSLYGLSAFLSDPSRTFTETLEHMKATPHDRGIAHARIAATAQAMLNKSEEERSGILSTALSFLGIYSDPIVARNTADSDFRIVDLMQAEYPMSLYIVVPDSDRLRLKPLTRMMMTMITQRLVEKLNPKENRHRLLMLIDEFPRLGKLPFFTDALPILAGYNIKAMLVMQSKAQLDAPEAYGHGNTIIEGCKVRSVYTPQDPATAQWISDALGPKTEVHQQTTFTGHRLAPWLGHVMVSDQESARPLLDAAEICKLSQKEMILLVAGFAPIRARRLKYYQHPELAERAGRAPVKLKPGGPYPYRPPPHPNPWAGKVAPKNPPAVAPPVAAPAAAAPPPDQPQSESSDHSRLTLALSAGEGAPESEEEGMLPPGTKRAKSDIDQQLDLLTSEEEMMRRRALDEFERQSPPQHRMRRRIPF
jgi:type IV secretion system protein VirD4